MVNPMEQLRYILCNKLSASKFVLYPSMIEWDDKYVNNDKNWTVYIPRKECISAISPIKINIYWTGDDKNPGAYSITIEINNIKDVNWLIKTLRGSNTFEQLNMAHNRYNVERLIEKL